MRKETGQSVALSMRFSNCSFITSFRNYTTSEPNLSHILKHLTPPPRFKSQGRMGEISETSERRSTVVEVSHLIFFTLFPECVKGDQDRKSRPNFFTFAPVVYFDPASLDRLGYYTSECQKGQRRTSMACRVPTYVGRP